MKELLLSKEETSILRTLKNEELVELKHDGWSAQLCFNHKVLSIQPEKIDIPTDHNLYGDINTLKVEEITRESFQLNEYRIYRNCGTVTKLLRLESLVQIESPRPVGPTKVLGVDIPAGIGWSNNILHPQKSSSNINLYRTLLGLKFQTEKEYVFTIYSDANGYFALLHQGNGEPEELRNECEHIEI